MENNEQHKESSKIMIGVVQLIPSDDKAANIQRVKELVEAVVKLHKCQIVFLPENANCPSKKCHLNAENIEDLDNPESTLSQFRQLAKNLDIYLVAGSIPIKENGKIYNTCYCIDRSGEVKAEYRKIHLFDADIPGKVTAKESDIISPGNSYGVFETEFCKIGVGICYDVRFPEYSLLLKKEFNVDVLTFPACFHEKTGEMHWEILSRSRALDNNVFVVMPGQGKDTKDPESYKCWGHSTVVDPFGFVQASIGQEEGFFATTIDLNKNKEISEQIPTWKNKRYGQVYDLTIPKQDK